MKFIDTYRPMAVKKEKLVRWSTLFVLVIVSLVTNLVNKSLSNKDVFQCTVEASYKNNSNSITNCMLYNTDRLHHGIEIDRYKVFFSRQKVFIELVGRTDIQNKTLLEETINNCLSSPHLDIFNCSQPFRWKRVKCAYKWAISA